MISVLLTIGALAMVGIVGPLIALISENQATYGSRLEEYISNKQPRDVADVERFTRQYELEASKRYL
jgi:hypothetical protein